MPEWLSVLALCIRPLFSVAMMQNIGIMLQKIMSSEQALRVLPPPTFQEYLVFRGTQPVLQLSEQLAVHRLGPDDVSASQ